MVNFAFDFDTRAPSAAERKMVQHQSEAAMITDGPSSQLPQTPQVSEFYKNQKNQEGLECEFAAVSRSVSLFPRCRAGVAQTPLKSNLRP